MKIVNEKIRVNLAIDHEPELISEFKKVKWVQIELPLAEEVRIWLETMAALYGLDSIQSYVNAALERRYCGCALVFSISDLLEFVAPVERKLVEIARARFLFAEALDSGEGAWGDGWRCEGTAHEKLREKSWREEVDAWLEEIGEAEHRADWQVAIDHAVAGRARDLGKLVRTLTSEWSV